VDSSTNKYVLSFHSKQILYILDNLIILLLFHCRNGYDECSHISTGTCLAFSQCITYLAAVTTDKNLTIWKTSNQELVRQFKTARKVSSLTFTNDATMLIVAG